jgi:hypothetical protein
MITIDKLPAEFLPYDELTICSNRLIGGGQLLVVGDVVPLIIGRGAQPMIWLQASTGPSGKEFLLIVEASVSRHPAITVQSRSDGLTVSAGPTAVLRIASFDAKVAKVDLLDFRPIGMTIFGGADQLNVSGMTFRSSTATGTRAMIALGA